MMTSTNPSRGHEVLAQVPASTARDVHEAVARAHAAQASWSALPLTERCAALSAWHDVCAARLVEIAELIARETGRPIRSARGNTAAGLDYLRAYVDLAPTALQPVTTVETDTELHRVYREPWGVVAAICPWNFPLMNVVWQCVPALLAGNAVVYKNSEENPLFAQLVEQLFAAADFPADVFTVVYGDGAVGDALARSDVNLVSFTGSAEVGKQLAVIAAERLIPFVGELGGSAPCLIFDDVAVTDELSEFLFAARFTHSGQDCCAMKRLIVHEDVAETVVDRLISTLRAKRLGDAIDESTDLGPLVAERQVARIEDQVRDAVEKGATVVAGGRRPHGMRGSYYEPTLLVGVTGDMRVWNEETFGPVLPIVTFATEAEALDLANDSRYGLGAYVQTQDRARLARLAHGLRSGMVAQNQVSFVSPHNPFGGYGESGLGRGNGVYAFSEMTQLKVVSAEKPSPG